MMKLGPTLALVTLLSACNMAPAYHVPTSAPAPAAFKAEPGWTEAAPADDAARGQWWQAFGDPVLDGLENRLVVTSQTIAASRAAWEQARAAVTTARAAMLPSGGISGGASRTGDFAGGGASPAKTGYSTVASGSWDIDLWGALGNGVHQAHASADASAADLANATLSARAALAEDYFTLRGIDAEAAMLAETVAGYQRSLAIARNKFAAGTVAHADVYSAEATLANAEAQAKELARQRAVLEDAIAVLVGENPSAFTIAPANWAPKVPEVPGILPSTLLQRRPDIAAAERRVAAANAGIGIARAAWFPAISLSGSASSAGSSFSSLFAAGTTVWSLGGSAAETLLDFGARAAKVKAARGAYDAAVATYRQAVLTAFQQVEDNLAASTAYADEADSLARASGAADKAETITRNEYAAGTVDYTTVSAAQGTAYSARAALIQNTVNRQGAAAALVVAIGGGWLDQAAGRYPPS